MKTAPWNRIATAYPFLAALAALGAVFICVGAPRAARAQIVPQSSETWALVASGDSNVTFYMGTSTAAETIGSISIWTAMDGSLGTSTTMYLRVTCFANTYSTSQAGCTDTSSHTSNTIEMSGSLPSALGFTFTPSLSIQSGKVYLLEIFSSAGKEAQIYGSASYQFGGQCDYLATGSSDCTGTPYFAFDAIPDWTGLNATSTPLTALYQDGASSTLALIQERCTGTNVFGEAICAAFSFVFIPSPTVLNNYAQLPALAESRFPFSWISQGQTALAGLVASSSANFTPTMLNLHDLGIGSTTAIGNILPNVTAISSSTITTYIGAGMWNTIQTILAAFAWLILFWYVWQRTTQRFARV